MSMSRSLSRLNRLSSGLVSTGTPTITFRGLLGLHTKTNAFEEAPKSTLESKYAEKLKQRAQERGLSVAELKVKAREVHAKQRTEARYQASTSTASVSAAIPSTSSGSSQGSRLVLGKNVRNDGSPVKPLSTILNIPRLFSTPHTADQISAIWTAYHVSLTGGTGRGYICASVPLKLYEKMMTVSAKYPVFVAPILRAQKDPSGEAEKAYEFYFLQWSFHGAPPVPSAIEDPFTIPNAASNSSQISTVMFTPLQEYKMRETFATPYLVLTFYTDLSNSHGTVLMRGEITPGAAGAVSDVNDAAGPKGKHLLSQEDAQLLAMQVQRFYLWENEKDREGERLLKVFHEQPQEFKWEDLLKQANLPM